ncbi:prion-inhibition and propagation-domain-containing protein [Rhexocercosporidium sp. MPI-PUGE-AT-0058]|nr:prion-inhibition and propagation-domain-containing protein [Rhexocercosporidium sp. MPI-PUGE-AT-0058]
MVSFLNIKTVKMATGFDAAAGAVGFASLGVLLLQGCVKGFVLLTTAQHFGQDADLVRTAIEFEQYRLFTWAEKVGLESGSPIRNMNWWIVHRHLKGLEALLSDIAKFKSEYRLELITTEEKLSLDDLAPPTKSFRRLFKPEFHSDTARALQKGVSIWKRLKWAAIDKDGVDLLMIDIRRFVDDLWAMLQADDLEFVRRAIEALARHAISQTKESKELSELDKLLNPEHRVSTISENRPVQSALTLKQQSLAVGYAMNDESSSLSPKHLSRNLTGATLVGSSKEAQNHRSSHSTRTKTSRGPLSFKALNIDPAVDEDELSREMGTYDGKRVIVEWKTVDSRDESKLKHRIKSLASLLQEIDSPSFHSLKCSGYLKDPKNGRYGYIFQTPNDRPRFFALDQVLRDHMATPCLDDRLKMAIALVETILQLHTSGWMHKGVYSGNVLFFQDGADLDLSELYLEGYEYARADNPSDMTESPMPQQEANLSRHPDLLKANRASFRKVFDLYGLGCVLMEIGLWESLTTILVHFLRRETQTQLGLRVPPASLEALTNDEMEQINMSKARILNPREQSGIWKALEFAAGKTFTAVVKACLSAADQKIDEEHNVMDEDDDYDMDDMCIDLELDVLQQLKKCRV